MDQPQDIAEEPRRRRRHRMLMPLRRPRWALVIWGIVLLIALLIVVVWLSRIRIATDLLEREFEERGVRATYRVTRIGLRTQRIENLVLGDPANPDLTAQRVELDVALSWPSPRVRLITVRGVRLKGRVVNGKLRLGELDKLLPPPTDAPFRLPNQRVDIADAQMRLDTPEGQVGLSIEGRGNLAYSFEGRVAAVSRRLTPGDCMIDGPRAVFAVTTKDEEPSFRGPLRAGRIECNGLSLLQPQFALRATLDSGLDGWRGDSGVRAARLSTGGNSFSNVAGRVSFDGDAGQTRGNADLAAAAVAAAGYRAGPSRIDGRYVFSPKSGNVSLLADVSAAGVDAGSAADLGGISKMLASADGTPLDPIGDALAAAVRRAGRALDADASLRFVKGGKYQAVRVERLNLASRSGARLTLRGEDGFTYYWPSDTFRLDADFALSGGGFPDMRFNLSQPRGSSELSGVGGIAPMAAGSSRLVLSPIRFVAGANGRTSIETTALLSGPFNDGRVEGLMVPIRGTLAGGSFAFGESCTNVSFRSLRAAGLTLGPTRLPLCPTGRALVWRNPGGALQAAASIRAPRLAGRLGQTPIGFAADQVRFDLAQSGFTSSGVELRLGSGDNPNRLDLGSLSGRFNARGVVGRFEGGSGKLANVPLLLSGMAGDWSVQGGDLLITGGMTVADEQEPDRFHPLVTNDFRLTLRDNVIDGTGWLNDPETGTQVTRATITHALQTGRGHADLDVPGIRFGADYQPEQLTPLTTGVIALVDGTLTGKGRISWGPEGTRSTGTFSTADMDLAAPFGPVTGLTTTIEFTDLLGLVSAPGQLAEIDLIQAGIDVFDGRVRYQLLPDLHVRVEEGRWPFAGGDLTLGETILDFSQESTKRLVFTVTGLEAAAFIQQMEFSNIAATGTFDGVVPMEFDQTGGRIVGGRLVARPEGGTLSYIGELTDKELGAYGKLAFDALKSLRYSKLTIDLDGALAGEFLARIELDGIATNTAPQGGIAGYVLGQIAKIPFEFNINIRGPFRALIATARSFEDPTLLIQPVLPEQLQDLPTEVTVQDEESENVR
jgi:hypothetical protein